MEETPQEMNGGKGEKAETVFLSFRVKAREVLRENVFFYAAGLLALAGLKWHGHGAGAEDLEWMLRPLAGLVGWTGGIPFEREPGAGFISLSRGIVIAPSCAGLNFLIISFASLFFSFVHRIGGFRGKILWLALAGSFAFLLTLGVNTLRILLSMELYEWDIYGLLITPERVHRLAGTVLYLSALLAAYGAARLLFRHSLIPGQAPGAVISRPFVKPGTFPLPGFLPPVLWYLAVTVGIPLAGLTAGRKGAGFQEHAVTVVMACLVILLPAVFLRDGQGGRTRKRYEKSYFYGRLCKKPRRPGARSPRNEAYLPARRSDEG